MRCCFILLLFCQFGFADDARHLAYEKRQDWFESRGIVGAQLQKGTRPQYLNELIYADSPYLLSHALQPINWQQWGKNTLNQAREAGKLIYLSIGYDTCHWCHVLSNETYVETEVADLLNRHFINVKVDREVSPEIDAKYRFALETMTGNPGWPIQVILTPQGHILWIDSYQPKPKLLHIFRTLSNKWSSNPANILAVAESLDRQLLPANETIDGNINFTDVFAQATSNSITVIEAEQAGKGPRFLRANWLLVLLNQYQQNQDNELLALVIEQVRQLVTSPTYDFIDGGMHRYAEDGHWKLPHFEKMLYDQAQLIRVLARIYAITGQFEYLDIANQVQRFVEENLYSGQYFLSSLSALSDGIEGQYYQIDPTNFEFNDSVKVANQLLYLQQLALPDHDFDKMLKASRKGKNKPRADTKGILAWNMYYILAMTELYQVTLSPELKTKVLNQFSEIASRFVEQGKVYRILTKGGLSKGATLEDYALLAQGYLAIYGISRDNKHLIQAEVIAKKMLTQLNNTELIGMSTDTQLPSAVAASLITLKALYQKTRKRVYSDQLNLLARNELTQPLSLSQLSLIAAADKKQSKMLAPYYFGLGNGIAYFDMREDDLFLILSLEEGWHINSNNVNNDKLIATKVEFVGSGIYGKIGYPNAELKTVKFEAEKLSLFSGEVKIKLDRNVFEKSSTSLLINVELQVCSDKLCLFPEQFNLAVRPKLI
jgi:uncharacterized protein YyaL (SSP411 family)